jgi:hypothetical protein
MPGRVLFSLVLNYNDISAAVAPKAAASERNRWTPSSDRLRWIGGVTTTAQRRTMLSCRRYFNSTAIRSAA